MLKIMIVSFETYMGLICYNVCIYKYIYVNIHTCLDCAFHVNMIISNKIDASSHNSWRTVQLKVSEVQTVDAKLHKFRMEVFHCPTVPWGPKEFLDGMSWICLFKVLGKKYEQNIPTNWWLFNL